MVNSKKDNKKKTYKVKVTLDQSKCINCGTCEAIFPQAYAFDETTNKHKVLPPYNDWTEVDEETLQKLKDAEMACPVLCIKVLEE